MPLPALALLALAAPPDPPRFVAHPADGPDRTAAVVRIGTVEMLLADGPAPLPLAGLVSLRRADRPLPAWPRGPQLVLASGDRVPGSVLGGDGPRVRVRTPLSPEPLAVPLAAVAAWWLVPPPADAPPDPARYPWRTARRADTVLLRNGDTVAGTVDTVAADGSTLTVVATEPDPPRVVELSRVAAVAFDPTLARSRKPKGPYFRAVLADGTRVGLTGVESDGRTVTGTTLFGAKAEVPLAAVVALEVAQGKAVPLAELKPRRAAVEPFNGLAWPWAADRTVKGNPLRLPGDAGGWFDRGLGTHPRTMLAYDLGGKYRRFEAVVGLDAATGRRGSAVVRVRVDGKDVTPAGLDPLTLAGSPVPVRVDVAGAKELELVVDFGPAGDVEADVNWGDARLVE